MLHTWLQHSGSGNCSTPLPAPYRLPVADPEVGACLELLLRSLERCPYTARVHHWVKMVSWGGWH